VVCLSVLNCTHCCVLSLCLYWILHFVLCGLSVRIKIVTLLYVIPLSVLNCTHFSLSSVFSVPISTHSCLWSVCHYWSLLKSVWVSVCTEIYVLLCDVWVLVLSSRHCCLYSVCLSVLNRTYCCVSVLNEMYKLVCVASLRYLTVHIAFCRLSLDTEMYTFVCVVCLSLLTWTHCWDWSVCRCWPIQISLSHILGRHSAIILTC